MSDARSASRSRQKQRTRKDLLHAAARLLNAGGKPTLEAVAEEALVSRATAYRYFPNVDALLLETLVDVATPDVDTLLSDAPDDLVERLERVDDAFNQMIADNEAPLRMMLAKSLERSIDSTANGQVPIRQNRRTPLIEAALLPARDSISPKQLKPLSRALALVIGTEARVVLKDVLQLSDKDALNVKRWAIRALVEAAQRS